MQCNAHVLRQCRIPESSFRNYAEVGCELIRNGFFPFFGFSTGLRFSDKTEKFQKGNEVVTERRVNQPASAATFFWPDTTVVLNGFLYF